MAFKLFIDDERMPPAKGTWVIARSSSDSITVLQNAGCPDFISFDHDLGGDDTAMVVVNWMIEKDLDDGGKFIPPSFQFYVHSQNSVGRENIQNKLDSYLKFRS